MNTKILIIGASVLVLAISGGVYVLIKPSSPVVEVNIPKADVDAIINRPKTEIDAEKDKILKAREKFKKSQGQ